MASASPTPVPEGELDELERRIDATFAAAELPTANRYSSRRAAVVATEDQLRFELERMAQASAESGRFRPAVSGFIQTLDRMKYALKVALNLIERRLPEAKPEWIAVDDAAIYTRAVDLVMQHGDAYATAIRVMSPLRAGTRDLFRAPDGALRVEEREHDRTHPALEGLVDTEDGGFSPIPLLAILFRGPRFFDANLEGEAGWAPEIAAIVSQTERRKDRIRYSFVLNRARWLRDNFDHQISDLPEGWVFPWATAEDATAVFVALQVRCLYHLIAIHFGARRWKVPGVGLDQICLETTLDQLAKDVAQVAELPIGRVRPLLDILVYGSGADTPDPALQPLVPVSANAVLLPPLLLLSSAWARNLLALHARFEPASFDAQSHRFEVSMVERLAAAAPPRFAPRPNIFLATRPTREEVDLLLVDAEARTLLLCELRWMLHPGEIREVLQRQKACRDKAAQVRRKRDAARAQLPAVLAPLALDAALPWRVEALVVIDNYGGVPSAWPKEIPVVPRKVFEEALGMAPDAERLHAAFTTTDWLPREGVDFVREDAEIDLGGVHMTLPTFRVTSTPYMRQSLGEYLRTAYERPAEVLRAQPW